MDLQFSTCVIWLVAGDGRQGKWEATGHIVKLQDSSEEVTMELRDSQKLPIDTTTGGADCAQVLLACTSCRPCHDTSPTEPTDCLV